MSSSREQQRIQDIIENIEAAQAYISTLSVEDFARSQITVDAVERCLQRVTEAVMKIGEQRFAIIAPAVSFHEVRGLGNRLRHEYDILDEAVVFNTVTESLPVLLACCRKALDQ
ncbi:HepT-like ribonuclease domain-containing protein [Blastomonas sp. AAP53]|uniref:HepT-like ribonuclease domain-containing protein n=1 Tax=Blastomonas sp. AAP53 TaxID=1248760 RepID=UPI000368532B|nr:HepT-like ribonuclease domain-containing protein [Blastomonas sp. AAP53]